jgi:ATP-dependent RNA helicase DeaD
VDTTKQTYYDVPHGKKQDALARVLDMETPGPTIVFCRTRMETDQLAESLRLRGYGAEALHGDMGQPERERVLRRFRDGQADLLIATEVAARGLDIDIVTHVINYDIPWDVEQYIHRVGRTGRAGRTGDAITLVTPRERRQLMFIEQAIGVKMTPARVPTTADIAARRRSRFQEALIETLTAGEYEGYLPVVSDLADDYDASVVAAAALKMLWKYWAAKAGPIDEEVAVETSTAAQGMARLFLGLGRQDGLRPADVVGALTREIGMDGRRIGAIDILDRSAFVEVPTEEAQDVINALRKTRIRNKKVTVQFAGPDRGAQPRY